MSYNFSPFVQHSARYPSSGHPPANSLQRPAPSFPSWTSRVRSPSPAFRDFSPTLPWVFDRGRALCPSPAVLLCGIIVAIFRDARLRHCAESGDHVRNQGSFFAVRVVRFAIAWLWAGAGGFDGQIFSDSQF